MKKKRKTISQAKPKEHTAAPWYALEGHGGFIEIEDKDNRLLMQTISDGPAAKKSEGWVPAAEAEANTRLVLASPRLYSVLGSLTAKIAAMRSALQKKDLEFPSAWLDDGILKEAQAALAEAAPRPQRRISTGRLWD